MKALQNVITVQKKHFSHMMDTHPLVAWAAVFLGMPLSFIAAQYVIASVVITPIAMMFGWM